MSVRRKQTTIQDLNDDCIYEIVKKLDPLDTLSVIGLFGRRFDDIAKRRLGKFRKLYMALRHDMRYNSGHLRLLGKNLRLIFVSAGYSMPERKVLRVVQPLIQSGNRRCLENLTLNYINFSKPYINCVNSVSAHLRKLDLSFCALTDELLTPVLERATNLRKLVLVGNYNLRGTSLNKINGYKMREVVLEQHEHWCFDTYTFTVKYPLVCITLYNKSRMTYTKFGTAGDYRNANIF